MTAKGHSRDPNGDGYILLMASVPISCLCSCPDFWGVTYEEMG